MKVGKFDSLLPNLARKNILILYIPTQKNRGKSYCLLFSGNILYVSTKKGYIRKLRNDINQIFWCMYCTTGRVHNSVRHSWVRLSWVRLSWVRLSWVRLSWVRHSRMQHKWVRLQLGANTSNTVTTTVDAASTGTTIFYFKFLTTKDDDKKFLQYL